MKKKKMWTKFTWRWVLAFTSTSYASSVHRAVLFIVPSFREWLRCFFISFLEPIKIYKKKNNEEHYSIFINAFNTWRVCSSGTCICDNDTFFSGSISTFSCKNCLFIRKGEQCFRPMLHIGELSDHKHTQNLSFHLN